MKRKKFPLLFCHKIKAIMNKIKLNKEIINILKTKRIIVIVGASDSGKTTEASAIAKELGKPVYCVIQKTHDYDTKLFDSLNFHKVIIGSEEKYKEKLSVALRNVTDSVIIFDDFHSAERSCKEYIDKKLLNFLKKKKKNLTLILNFHPQHIPSKFLNEEWSILLLKRNSNLNSRGLGKYLTKKLIGTPTEEKAKTIKDYSTMYLLKDGKYFFRDSNTDTIIEDEIIPKSCVNLSSEDKESICESVLNGNSYKELAEAYQVSKTTIHKMIKEKCQSDEDYQERYTFHLKQRTVGVAKKIAERNQNGVSLTVIGDQLTINDKKLSQYIEDIENKHSNSTDKNDEIIRQISQKLTYLENWKDLENIGNFAVKIIGEGIYEGLVKLVSSGIISKADMVVRLGKGGCDITIITPNRQIEIEVKNYKPTNKTPNLSKWYIKKEIIGDAEENKRLKRNLKAFSYNATDKWVFVCGRGISETGKRLLKKHDIKWKRLSYTQLKETDTLTYRKLKKKETNKKHHIKSKMLDFVKELFS